jgi:hypothetical protein
MVTVLLRKYPSKTMSCMNALSLIMALYEPAFYIVEIIGFCDISICCSWYCWKEYI